MSRNKIKTKAKKGYVLMVVMIFSFLVALTVTTCFVVSYRYNRLTKRAIDDLQKQIEGSEVDPTSISNVGQSIKLGGEVWNFTL